MRTTHTVSQQMTHQNSHRNLLWNLKRLLLFLLTFGSIKFKIGHPKWSSANIEKLNDFLIFQHTIDKRTRTVEKKGYVSDFFPNIGGHGYFFNPLMPFHHDNFVIQSNLWLIANLIHVFFILNTRALFCESAQIVGSRGGPKSNRPIQLTVSYSWISKVQGNLGIT